MLDDFQKRRLLWIECLNGKDRHSIMQQIYGMIWDTAVFHIINESRRMVPPSEGGGVQLNGLVHRLIDKCYFESQLLAIRRLTDCDSLADNPKRDVFSIISLLRDMKENAKLITRKNIFAAEGLEYDYESIRLKDLEHCKKQLESGEKPVWTPVELDWNSLEIRHIEFDFISGVSADKRSHADSLRSEIINFLEKKTKESCDSMTNHVNKFIAHAATPESRQIIDADNFKITLDDIGQAHKTLCEVGNFVSVYLLGKGTYSFLPTPQYNHFEYIERPLVTHENISKLHEKWDSYHKEASRWGSWGIEEFQKEFNRCSALGTT